VLARNTLIRSNVRLVISIAKRWASTMGKIQHSRKCVPLLLLFMLEMPLSHPVWMKPFKEGILGLVGAADRYDPSRDLRFSTYSTYWITNLCETVLPMRLPGRGRIPLSRLLVTQTLLCREELVCI
jgi:hypothetical protein